MNRGNALGRFNSVVYFESHAGEIFLPATADEYQKHPMGWKRKEASTLAELDALQKKMEEKDKRDMRSGLDHDAEVFERKRAKTRASLLRTITKSSTSEYEKDFIRHYLELSDERKRNMYGRDKSIHSFFVAREYDDYGNRTLEG